MPKKRLIGEQLHVGEIDDDELTIVLTDKFPRSAQFRPDEVEYRTMSDETVLTLKYRSGKIIDAEAWPAMSSDLEREITIAIDSVCAPSITTICRWTMFSSSPVEGTWRYRNELQIMPAPPEAPRPKVLFSALQPFLVDFAFQDSPNWQIRNIRYARKAADLVLVLNLFLNAHISAPSSRGREHWVWAPHGSDPPVIWAKEGYMIPNLVYIVDDFPHADVPALEMAPADRYHSRDGRTEKLTIPFELAELFDIFSTLKDDDRERFLRSCYWFHMASEVWSYSQSLHLTSLVNAIECLSSVGPARNTPEGPSEMFRVFMRRFTPGKRDAAGSGPGPTALFRRLMKKFAPGKPSGRMLDTIYGTRSSITHGERLLNFDTGVSSPGLSQNSASDREVGDSAVILCRAALINWLWEQRPAASGELLLTRGVPSGKLTPPGTKSGITVIVPTAELDGQERDADR